jgi:hypothetical protein
MMELDVRADEVRDDIGQRRAGDIFPERRMMLDRIRYPAKARRIRPMRGLEVEDPVGGRHAA